MVYDHGLVFKKSPVSVIRGTTNRVPGNKGQPDDANLTL